MAEIYQPFLCIMGYRVGHKQKQRKSEMRWLRLFITCPQQESPAHNQTCSISCSMPHYRAHLKNKNTQHALARRGGTVYWLIDIVSEVKHILILLSTLLLLSPPLSTEMTYWPRKHSQNQSTYIHSASVDIFAICGVTYKRACGYATAPVHYQCAALQHCRDT